MDDLSSLTYKADYNGGVNWELHHGGKRYYGWAQTPRRAHKEAKKMIRRDLKLQRFIRRQERKHDRWEWLRDDDIL